MKTNHKLKQQSGFTIIEVLIVLAIAGLIMLIVFLAVPALQRNSRNTQYRNDAAAILGGVNELTNNNNGAVPTSADKATILSNANSKNITDLDISSTIGAKTPTFSKAYLVTGAKCGAIDGTASNTPVSASTRSLALIYAVEKNNGTVIAQCTES